MQGASLGSVEFGKRFTFVVSDRDSDGSSTLFVPAFFDVIDPSDGSTIIANEGLTQVAGRSLWRGIIDSGTIVTDQSSGLVAYRTYGVMVKDSTSLNPSIFQLFNFTITGAISQRFERMLGLMGENVLLDLFVYDGGNNATSMRLRVFESASAASLATIDISAMEPGELYRYNVTQTFSSGLQLRLSHLSVIATDQGEG